MTVIADLATHALFVGLGVIALLAGAAVFRVDSMARATYALAISFIAVGLQVLMLSQTYVGVIVMLMMVMEMAVMAVYMVMFMGMNPALMPMSMVHDKRVAGGVSAGVFVVLVAGILLIDWPTRRGSPPADLTAELGRTLMESKMLVMAVVSPVMVATIVAGVSLAHARTRYDRLGDDLDGPPDDPQPGGVGR
jgi:NADH:ubiquinone oxidoreductase subunit 6 (subunit J)